MVSPEPMKPLTEPTTVAVIDVGSNSVRLVVAQVHPDGHTDVLERLQQPVRMGQDTFRTGRLSAQTVRAVVNVMRDYRRVLEPYDVRHVRAVATSAVREAANADFLLDRVFMTTGIEIEVIDTSEESRLTVSAVREALADEPALHRRNALIADVGGGSTLLTLLRSGEIAGSQALRLGAVRLQEVLDTSDETPDRSADLIGHQIHNVLSVLTVPVPLREVSAFVAVGGDIRFTARHVGTPVDSGHLVRVPRTALDAFVEQCIHRTPEELAKRHGIPFADAETLNPALMVYQALLQRTRAKELLVCGVSMRDGLLQDLARMVTGTEDEELHGGILRSAQSIADKYCVDAQHAHHVAALADRLFEALLPEHGLSPRHRLLLRVAGILHEVGGFVSPRSHHKHSYYLVANSEIFGLAREEIILVAHVARYHRRSGPKTSHLEYISLPRTDRMAVSKLAAILRVADALERGHAQQVREFWTERAGDEFIIYVPGVADLTLERRALASKGDLFEEIYGLRVRLEEAQPSLDPRHRRAEPME